MLTINTPRFGNQAVVADTFAELRSIPANKILPGWGATVHGGLARLDGLGGLFVWNENSTAEDDNETVICPTKHVALGRWEKVAVGQVGPAGPAGPASTVPGPQGEGLATVMAPGGAALVGTSGGNTVQSFIELVETIAKFGATGVGIGTVPSASRLTVNTARTFTGNAVDYYHYSAQTDPDNQTNALALHNYTDGVTAAFDTVGDKTTLILRQAHNPAARSDKPSTFVGDGPFAEWQRARPNGGGVYPNGNIGGNLDRLGWINNKGNFCAYGSNGADWAGDAAAAPIQLGTYQNFLSRKMYLGYRDDQNKSVIGSIDENAGAFTPIDIAALALRPIGDNAVGLGAQSLRFTAAYAKEFHPGSGEPIWTSGTGHPEGNIAAVVGSLWTRDDGVPGATLYIKETGSGVTGWRAI